MQLTLNQIVSQSKLSKPAVRARLKRAGIKHVGILVELKAFSTGGNVKHKSHLYDADDVKKVINLNGENHERTSI